MIKMYIYFKNGNVDTYEVAGVFKAREHAEKIWTHGYRMLVDFRMEWFGPHYIDKICWDVNVCNKDYLNNKYNTIHRI